jgi:hypothetical protein
MSRTSKTLSKKPGTPKAENAPKTPKDVQERKEDHGEYSSEEPENDLVEAPFYSMDKPFVAKHHETATILANIHRYHEFFQAVWSEYRDGENGDVVSGIAEAYELQLRCSTDPLILHLADLLGSGDYKGLLQIAQIFEDYEKAFPRLRGEEAKAKLFVMVACENLREIGYERDHISKPQIRHLADRMRAIRSLRSQKPIRNSPKIRRIFDIDSDLIEEEMGVLRLEKTAWTRIFRDLGLSDIRSGKPGPASRKE